MNDARPPMSGDVATGADGAVVSTSATTTAPTFCLFGAPADTGNLGVGALGESTLHSLHGARPDARILVFDNGRGRRSSPTTAAVPHERDGAWISRRLHRQESLWTMRFSGRFGFPRNRNVDAIRRASAVLDISGGDSFTDLYGNARWNLIVLAKLITLDAGTPLVLLPQTYGPFANERRRQLAASIVDRSHCAWTRDPDGLDTLRELLGDRFDEERHRQGVDVAFALPAVRPPDPVAEQAETSGDGRTVVGLNVSGLLMNDLGGATEQFGLSFDYRRVVTELARRLLADIADHLVLVPHVRGRGAESDDAACAALMAELNESGRISVLPPGLDAGQTKWFISQLDWFCGTRMHATIAALSSGVPAAAIAYSGKTRGVFETCGMAHAVVDARKADEIGAVDRLVELAQDRRIDRARLDERIDTVVARSRDQFVDIVESISGSRGGASGAR